jgi:hypothetical protein
VALLCGEVLKLCAAAAADPYAFVFDVLAQLKQALTAVQHAVVAAPPGSVMSLRQLIEQHAAAELQQQKAGGDAIAAATVLSLVQVL